MQTKTKLKFKSNIFKSSNKSIKKKNEIYIKIYIKMSKKL